MFSLSAICYLFLGGAGAGTLVVLSSLELINSKSRLALTNLSGFRWYRLPDELYARCSLFCLGMLALGILCLFVDLGRPDRILQLLFSPQWSAMAVGTYALVLAVCCAGFFVVLENFDSLNVPLMFVRVVGVVGVVTGLVTMVYTGVLLMSMSSVVFWQTPWVPILFVLSSLSMGIAGLYFSAVFVESRKPFLKPLVFLARIDQGLLVAEFACLAAYLVPAIGNPDARQAALALVAGDLSGLFWIGLIVCGLAVPLALEWFLSSRNSRTQLLWISVLVLAGGFLLRFCLVGAGDYDITQISDVTIGLWLAQ